DGVCTSAYIHHLPIAEVQRIRDVIFFLEEILGQEVDLVIVKVAAGANNVDQFVDVDAVDQRQAFVAQGAFVLERGLVVDELPLERGCQQPTADGNLAGVNGAEVGGQ